ncbi:TIGR04255 family protein [Nonomuraea sp. NPDC050547]|uniref:TIGR04255 family protein n=1 Tax=Nonomuraea sp. NPDC050547 TaxID=3364368 RepID=UPI0037A5082D
MTTREVYPSAPLRLVALELTFPLTTRLLSRTLWDQLEAAVADDLPDVSVFTNEPEIAIPSGHHDPILRRISEDRKRAVTLYAGAVTIELADYKSYGDLEELTERTLRALRESLPSSLSYTRVGLRYINEIRASAVGISDDQWHLPKAWMPYLNEQLLSQVDTPPEGLCVFGNRKSAFFHSKTGSEYISMQYGITSEGVVDPSDVLVLDGTSGPCFVLDFDASQFGSAKEPVATEGETVMETIARLHNLVESTFEWSVTDQSREVFRA